MFWSNEAKVSGSYFKLLKFRSQSNNLQLFESEDDNLMEIFLTTSPELRCPIYVDDIVQIVLKLSSIQELPKNRTFNMGGPQRLSRADMAVQVRWGLRKIRLCAYRLGKIDLMISKIKWIVRKWLLNLWMSINECESEGGCKGNAFWKALEKDLLISCLK
jgi:hypothetical protein